MKVIKVICILCFFFSSTIYGVEISYLTGKINLSKAQVEDSSTILTLPLGKLASGKLNLFHELKDNKHVINGNAEFKITNDKPVYLVYYLTLTDRKGALIAATNGDLQINQTGKIHQYASALMPLPLDDINKITNYQITLYESDQPIGG